jgi:hypothetical protein
VTGTPVIDKARATLYLDAMVLRDGHPRHEVYALSLADGSVESGWPVDVAAALGGSFAPVTQNQHGALALFAGRVYAPYGGLAGDCGVYHGTVVGISTSDPGKVVRFSTRARSGGIWAQGGVTSDGKSLFVATGNTSFVRDWGDGEAVLRFPPDLARPVAARDYFAPSNWKDLDDHDLDLGGSAPIPLDVPIARQESRQVVGASTFSIASAGSHRPALLLPGEKGANYTSHLQGPLSRRHRIHRSTSRGSGHSCASGTMRQRQPSGFLGGDGQPL